MFVQTIAVNTGIKVVCWSTKFAYTQRGDFATLKRGVLKNGRRSNSKAYAQAIGKEPLRCLIGNFSGDLRRLDRIQRDTRKKMAEESLIGFEVDNELGELLNMNANFQMRLGEYLAVDSLGVYLVVGKIQNLEIDEKENWKFVQGNNVFHLRDSIISDANIEDAREGIERKKRGDWKDPPVRKNSKDLSKVWVTRQDSLDSKNCQPGTDHFIYQLRRRYKYFNFTSIRADALLAIKDNSDTRRAIKQAIKRQNLL